MFTAHSAHDIVYYDTDSHTVDLVSLIASLKTIRYTFQPMSHTKLRVLAVVSTVEFGTLLCACVFKSVGKFRQY